MNEVIVSLQQKLENMKTLIPTEAATPEQISKYFIEESEYSEKDRIIENTVFYSKHGNKNTA